MNTQTTRDTMESGQRMGSEALAHASERAREWRSNVQDLASRGMQSVADSASAAQRQLGEYSKATGRYVADHPVKSALMAAALGAAVTGAFMALRRRRRSSTFY